MSIKFNYKVSFQFIGTRYNGSQKQLNVLTVEGVLLTSIQKVFLDVVKINIAGRTDTGVHASKQYLNFFSVIDVPSTKALIALNNNLPSDINIICITQVQTSFNARFDAISREYHYCFSNSTIPLEFIPFCTKITFNPREYLFKNITKLFLGTHDFMGFQKLGSNERTTIRTIFKCDIKKKYFKSLYENENISHYYVLEIKANSFLYRMVRNIVGAIFEVLKGNKSSEDLKKLIEFQDKTKFLYSPAKANGLCLVKVNY